LLWALPVLVPVLVYLCIFLRYRLDPPDLLGQQQRDEVIRVLRAALEAVPAGAPATGLEVTPAGPVWVTV